MRLTLSPLGAGFVRLFLFLALTAALRAQAEPRKPANVPITRFWTFTEETALTIDLDLAPDAQPDWTQSVLSLTRLGAPESVQTIRFSFAQVSQGAEPTIRRVCFTHLAVTPWTPTQPTLYQASLKIAFRDGRSAMVTARPGFRSFKAENARFYLNGRPIFLRGFAINPPGRGIPTAVETSRKFAEDYLHYLKSININIIRIPDDQTWYDVCDEVGMMVFGGNYSGKVDGHGPSEDAAASAAWFRNDKFYSLTGHPSLMIYALTNETPFGGQEGAQWNKFLDGVYRELQPWDPTRLYIANAGYGYGKVGEIDDLHRYWGWYYESPFTYLHLRDYDKLMLPGKSQPLTFTESVGNYNGPDGRVNLTPHHKNPLAQFNWIGTAPMEEQGALEFAHQSLTIKEATELFRRLRPINPKLSGIFPFTILFNRWNTIRSFAEMDPKPAARQLAKSFSPVLLSWELYTPQVYAGSTLHPIAHIVNDADDASDLPGATIDYVVEDSTQRAVVSGRTEAGVVPYYGTARLPLSISLPANLATGNYSIHGWLRAGGRLVAENDEPLYVSSLDSRRSGHAASRVRIFDPAGATRQALDLLGVPSDPLDFGTLGNRSSAVVVGERAAAGLSAAQAAELLSFATSGGRLLVLRQDPSDIVALRRLLPVAVRMPTTTIDDPLYPPPPRPSRDGFNVNPERPEHPIFAGIDRRRLHIWSDFTGWDEQKPGMPRIYPVDGGIVLEKKEDTLTTAILADYSQDLEGIALAEFYVGQGSVLYSAFELSARANLDPVADRLLSNLVAYADAAAGHECSVLIDAPIVWGRYETEKGVLVGSYSGLMLNSRPALTGDDREMPIRVSKNGDEFAGEAEAWNSRPAVIYEPFGRRPFGPYFHSGWSGVAEPENPADSVGKGFFQCRIPSGKNRATHLLFNPSKETLSATVTANRRSTTVEIAAGETKVVSVPLEPGTTLVRNEIDGDRRLVLLESSFNSN